MRRVWVGLAIVAMLVLFGWSMVAVATSHSHRHKSCYTNVGYVICQNDTKLG